MSCFEVFWSWKLDGSNRKNEIYNLGVVPDLQISKKGEFLMICIIIVAFFIVLSWMRCFGGLVSSRWYHPDQKNVIYNFRVVPDLQISKKLELLMIYMIFGPPLGPWATPSSSKFWTTYIVHALSRRRRFQPPSHRRRAVNKTTFALTAGDDIRPWDLRIRIKQLPPLPTWEG